MYIAYSSVIDWVLNDHTVSEDDALAALPALCRRVVRAVLKEGMPYKLSFVYADDGGIFHADFTPRRHHPRPQSSAAWVGDGDSPLDAILKAKARWDMRQETLT